MRGGTKRRQIRATTFLFAILLILGAVTPIAPLVVWLLPAPLLYLWLNGERYRVFVLCGTTILITLFGGSLSYLSILVFWALLSAGGTGEAWKRGSFPVSPLAIGTLLLTGISIFCMGVAFIQYGYSLPDDLGEQVHQLALHDTWALQMQTPAENREMAVEYQTMIKDNFPAILIIVCFLITFFNVYLVRWKISKRKPEQYQKGGFSDWKLPLAVAWICIAVYLLSFIDWPNNLHIVQIMVENVVLVSSFFLALQGLSLIWRAIYRYHIGKWSMLAVVALSTIHLVWLLYIIIGCVDCIYRNRLNVK